MASASGYHRPRTMAEALRLLARPRTMVIGGGTKLAAAAAAGPVEVVDLQALGLSGIRVERDGSARIGSTTTLQEVADDDRLPPVVRDAARREQPSTLRTAATVGGCVATADPSSELLAALLVHDTVVEVAGMSGAVDLAAALESGPGARIITAVVIDTGGTAAAARTARTPADRPIVAAVARRGRDGRMRVAVTGVAPTPVLVTDPATLDPAGDFLGSAEYRRSLAATLVARAVEGTA